MSKLKAYGIVLLLTIVSTVAFSQSTIILNQPETGNQVHAATQSIHFVPGYSYVPTTQTAMVAYIDTLGFRLTYTTTPETPEAMGSIELTPFAGNPPYYYFWSDGDQSQNRYGLPSGIYTVTVKDSLGDSLVVSIPVTTALEWAEEPTGVTIENDELQKAEPDGWGNGLASLTNIIEGEGSIQITIEEANFDKEWAFGFRLESNPQINAYQELNYGYYIRERELYVWVQEWGDPLLVGEVRVGDVISIERSSNETSMTYFKKNGILLSEIQHLSEYSYKVDFTLYSLGVVLKPKIIIFSFWPRVTAVITHNKCYEENAGAINISLNNSAAYPYTYVWSTPSTPFTWATQDISGLAPGDYTVAISWGTHTIYRTYSVGYEVEWKNVAEATTNGNSITKTTATGYGTSGASSINILRTNQSGWIEFKVPQYQNTFTVGFADIDSDKSPASIDYGFAFFYFSFGTFGTFNLFGVVENGVVVPSTVTSYNTNQTFKMQYNPPPAGTGFGTINYYRAYGNFFNFSLLPTPQNFYTSVLTSTPNKLLLDVALSEQGKGITNVNTSFGCPPPGYAILDKKLNAGFYSTVKQHLWFQYNEEYSNNSTLNAVIYGENQSITHSIPAQTISKTGANYYDLDLTTLSPVLNPNKFYVLEVTNSKNEKYLLRFLYQ